MNQAFIAFAAASAWLTASMPAWAQAGKPIVAIYQMDDLAKSGQAETFSAMIETAISQTQKFRVMERSRMAKLLSEQGKARSGLVTSNSPRRTGGFEGVDYLIYGSITSITVQKKQDIAASLLGGVLSGKGNSSCAATLAVLGADIKITDSDTGEVRYVTRIDQEAKSGASCDGSTNVDVSALLRGAADSIATGLVTAVYPVQVAAIQPDGTMILNYGSSSLFQGQVLKLFQKGEPILDPATGAVLASNDFELGMIVVTDVTPQISRARAVTPFAAAPTIGAIARPVSDAEAKAALKPARKGRR